MQSFHMLTFRRVITFNDLFVAWISHFLTYLVLIVGHKDALAMATILLVQLHSGMKGGAAASKEVKNQRIIFCR